MASIFDQYEQAAHTKPTNTPVTQTSSYVSVKREKETPVFSKRKMNFTPSATITHIAVANDYLVVAMANTKLFRIDFQHPDKFEDVFIGKFMQPNTKLSSMFLDPLGFHLLLGFTPKKDTDAYPEMMYLHRRSTKLKAVSKFRNYEVTEVGWNFENKMENTTGPILLGTSRGLIMETEIGPDTDKIFQIGIEQYFKQVFDIGRGTNTPITGLEFHKVNSTNTYFIFVTTPKRLYQFIGYADPEEKPLLQPIFNTYLNKPETGFHEIQSKLGYSKLQFMYDNNTGLPKTFYWLTEPGIFFSQIDPASQANSKTIIINGALLDYPPLRDETDSNESEQKAPLSFVLTEFHALLLYEDHIKAISLLDETLVYEEEFPKDYGNLKNIVKDQKRGTIMAITDKAVFTYKITREERNVWQIYCDKNEFDLAKQYCESNPVHVDSINVKQAEFLFENGEFEQSAEIYANTQSSFERICLKFLEVDQIDALQIYLRNKFNELKQDDWIQKNLLVIWQIELYLSQLGFLRRSGQEDTKKYADLQLNFEEYLRWGKVKEIVQQNKSVIYDLIASHGDKHNLIHQTMLNQDYDNVISQHIFKKSYLEALDALSKQTKRDLFYQFCPVLLQEVPKHTVNVLISKGKGLSPLKLLPGLLACDNDEEHISEIVRYLEYCVQDLCCVEQAIHNYLLSLYTEHQPDALMRYLARQGHELSMVNFDVHYALRLCREKNLPAACVWLSALLRLWEAALELAVESGDLKQAKKIADMPDDDPDLRKKLWLKIAKHVISSNQDMKEALDFLQQCELIKIEDILPFFSDVVTIDLFREPICKSLEKYNEQIHYLKAEMDEATKAAELVRAEIQSFRNQSTIVLVTDSCCLCAMALLLRPFYLFPCGHRYHNDCLTDEILPLLSSAKRNKLGELQRQLTSGATDSNSTSSTGVSHKERLARDMDDIVAAECLYCGEYMIQYIDKPFIAEDDWDRVMKEWE